MPYPSPRWIRQLQAYEVGVEEREPIHTGGHKVPRTEMIQCDPMCPWNFEMFTLHRNTKKIIETYRNTACEDPSWSLNLQFSYRKNPFHQRAESSSWIPSCKVHIWPTHAGGAGANTMHYAPSHQLRNEGPRHSPNFNSCWGISAINSLLLQTLGKWINLHRKHIIWPVWGDWYIRLHLYASK